MVSSERALNSADFKPHMVLLKPLKPAQEINKHFYGLFTTQKNDLYVLIWIFFARRPLRSYAVQTNLEKDLNTIFWSTMWHPSHIGLARSADSVMQLQFPVHSNQFASQTSYFEVNFYYSKDDLWVKYRMIFRDWGHEIQNAHLGDS